MQADTADEALAMLRMEQPTLFDPTVRPAKGIDLHRAKYVRVSGTEYL